MLGLLGPLGPSGVLLGPSGVLLGPIGGARSECSVCSVRSVLAVCCSVLSVFCSALAFFPISDSYCDEVSHRILHLFYGDAREDTHVRRNPTIRHNADSKKRSSHDAKDKNSAERRLQEQIIA